jgi:sporulation protein YlmC with PRC-barrel domain
MKTNLALTLVGAALISLPAMAQTSSTPPADSPPKAATSSSSVSATPMYEMKAGQWRATKLTGVSVYNNNNEKIGDVNELIVDRDGKAQAVVIGVGGFLGMGEHLAAVPWDKVKWLDTPRDTTASRTTTTTTGSGTSTAPATTTQRTERTDSAGNTTTTERTDRPATATDRPATTTTTRTAANDAYRGYPDHAVVDMSKDQLKALPEVKYAR